MVGKEDFEAGMYGDTLSKIISCLSETHPKGYSQLKQDTGLGGGDLDKGLSELEKLGYIESKRLREGLGDNVFYLKRPKSETSKAISSVSEIQFDILSYMRDWERSHDSKLVDANTVAKALNLSVADINDEIDILEADGAIKVARTFGDNPSLWLTGKGKKILRYSTIEPNLKLSPLKELLMKLDPELERKRLGAWQALETATVDRHSQAANSMREVLRQFLQKLSPDYHVVQAPWYSKPKQGSLVTRAMRVRYALAGTSVSVSESALKQINALSAAADATYAKLSDQAHKDRAGKDETTRAYLTACESVMELIVANRGETEEEDIQGAKSLGKNANSSEGVHQVIGPRKSKAGHSYDWNLHSLERLGIPQNFAPLLLGVKEHGAWVSSIISSKSSEERYAEIIVDIKQKSPNIPMRNLSSLAVVQLQAEMMDSELLKEVVRTFLKYEP